MALPPRFLDELRSRLTLSEVVGRRVKLVRAGREFKACCPFHNEKTPSFYVNDGKGFFHCFGCGAHGDAIGFTMRIANMPFTEAVEQLAAEAGLEVPQATPQERARFERQRTLYDLLEQACTWFEAQLRLPHGRAALDYLKGRGLDADTLARFRIGYAPQDAGALRQHLAGQGWSDADMVEAGLLKRPDDGRAPFAFFRNRVLFPIQDERGRVVAFGGRKLDGDGPKYVNSSDNPLFRKGRLLYNFPLARASAAVGQEVVVVEGYLDVISMVRAGFAAAVAPLGTALTEEQLQLAWRIARESERGLKGVVLCFDGDAAGIKAAWRAAERALPLLQSDRTLSFVFLPVGEDPDSLLRQPGGREALTAALNGSTGFIDFLWNHEVTRVPPTRLEELIALEQRLLTLIKEIPDKAVQLSYRREVFDRCYQLRRRLNLAANGNVVRFAAFRASKRDATLLAVLVNRPDILRDFDEEIGQLDLPEPMHKIASIAGALVRHDETIDADRLQAELRAEVPDVDRVLEKLNYIFRLHVNVGDRDEGYLRSVVAEIIRAKYLRALKGEVGHWTRKAGEDDDQAAWKRVQALGEEIARYKAEATEMVNEAPVRGAYLPGRPVFDPDLIDEWLNARAEVEAAKAGQGAAPPSS
ncbi:MAG TPA: DNA primase [Azospirillaceae bacterium]|nr:DNA primase [Azospirillaceae bacterium]